MVEAKYGTGYPRINKLTATFQLFLMFLMMPAFVIGNYVDTRVHVKHAGTETIGFLCVVWLVVVACVIWYGRERPAK